MRCCVGTALKLLVSFRATLRFRDFTLCSCSHFEHLPMLYVSMGLQLSCRQGQQEGEGFCGPPYLRAPLAGASGHLPDNHKVGTLRTTPSDLIARFFSFSIGYGPRLGVLNRIASWQCRVRPLEPPHICLPLTRCLSPEYRRSLVDLEMTSWRKFQCCSQPTMGTNVTAGSGRTKCSARCP